MSWQSTRGIHGNLVRWLFGLGVLLAFTAPGHVQQPQSEWIADASTGCRVWNSVPQPDETIRWDGPCVNGLAHGRGMLRWFQAGRVTETGEGEFRNGKMHGYVVLMNNTNGLRFEGNFADQKPHGQGTLRLPNGEVYSGQWWMGCFDDGRRQYAFLTTREACGSRI
jgi:hypothetical protein